MSRIASHLFEREGVSPVELAAGEEEREREGFLNHKFNHLISVQYSVAQRENEWHVIFKLASNSSMRLVLLSDPQGIVTDSNLLAQTAFKDAEAQVFTEGRPFSLAEIGLENFNAASFRRQNGCSASIRLGARTGECMVQV